MMEYLGMLLTFLAVAYGFVVLIGLVCEMFEDKENR